MNSVRGVKDREVCQKYKSSAIKLKNTKSVTNPDLRNSEEKLKKKPQPDFMRHKY